MTTHHGTAYVMKISKGQLIVWSTGLLAPLWLLLINSLIERFMSVSVSGRWLYASIILGALICATAISVSRFAVWQRIALILASWLLIAGEVLTLGAFLVFNPGVSATQ